MTSEQDLLSLTDPSIPSNTLSLLMSLWMTWFACRKSNACKHCRYGDKWKETGMKRLFCLWLSQKDEYGFDFCSPIVKRAGYLSADSSYLGFVHAGLCDDVCQWTTGQILHHHKQLLPHQETDMHTQIHNVSHTAVHPCFAEIFWDLLQVHLQSHLSKKLTMFGFFNSFITRISLMISSFFGCFCRLICLMATWKKTMGFSISQVWWFGTMLVWNFLSLILSYVNVLLCAWYTCNCFLC